VRACARACVRAQVRRVYTTETYRRRSVTCRRWRAFLFVFVLFIVLVEEMERRNARAYICVQCPWPRRGMSAKISHCDHRYGGGGFFSLYVIKTRAATQMHSTRAKRCSANVRQSTSVPFDVFFPFPNDRRRRERVLNNKYNEYVVVIVDGTKQFFFHEIFSGVYANVSETPNGERNFFGSFRVRSRKRVGKIKPSNERGRGRNRGKK